MIPCADDTSPNIPVLIASKTFLNSPPTNFPFCSHCYRLMSSTWCTLAPKMNMLSSPTSSAISTLAPSIVPMINPPFIMNFMFEVPDASVPAVEMCCDSSEAGIIIYAFETL